MAAFTLWVVQRGTHSSLLVRTKTQDKLCRCRDRNSKSLQSDFHSALGTRCKRSYIFVITRIHQFFMTLYHNKQNIDFASLSVNDYEMFVGENMIRDFAFPSRVQVIALTQAAAELPPPSSSNGQSNDSHRSQPANNASGLSSFTGAPTPTMGPNMNMLGNSSLSNPTPLPQLLFPHASVNSSSSLSPLNGAGGLGAAMHLNGFFGQSPASLQMNGFSGSQQGTGGTHDMTTATAAPQLGSGAGTPSAATHFGLPQGVPGMNFPQILASAGAMNINPAAMMSMGIPTSIINLATQTPNAFTNAHARPQMAQNSGMPMPISGGGGFPGMNPAFMAGGGMGMGHGVQNNIRHNGPRAQPPIQGGIRGFAPNGVGPGGPLRPGFASGHGERSRSPSRERRDRDRDGHRGGPDR